MTERVPASPSPSPSAVPVAGGRLTDGPPVRHRRDPRRRQRRPEADARLRARPRRRPTTSPGRAARSSSARTPAARATCSWRRSPPGRRASASTSTSSASSRRRPSPSSPAAGPFAAGIMVSASHNPADDNGLKVLDRDGLKLDDAIEDELEQLIWRTEELAGRRQRRARPDRSTRADLARRLPSRTGSASRRRSTPPASGSCSTAPTGRAACVGPEILAATGATVEVIHAEPDGVQHQRPVRRDRPRPRSPRRSSRRGADVGFALDGDADRLIAVDAAGGSSTATRSSGILALDRLGRGALPGGGLVVSVLSNGGLQAAVEAAGGQVVRTPVGDKYILEGMQVSGRGPRRREERPRHRARAHDLGRRDRDRARGPAGHGGRSAARSPTWPPRSRCCPQQQRAVKARHKDQWEGDPGLQRADRRGAGPAGTTRPDPRPAVRHGARAAGHGRGPGRGARARAGRRARALAEERLN